MQTLELNDDKCPSALSDYSCHAYLKNKSLHEIPLYILPFQIKLQ